MLAQSRALGVLAGAVEVGETVPTKPRGVCGFFSFSSIGSFYNVGGKRSLVEVVVVSGLAMDRARDFRLTLPLGTAS